MTERPHAQLLDLLHLGNPRVIGVYLIETEDGLALADTGPTTCLPALEAALGALGHQLADIRHLLLTHIHLDHAGAAGAIAAQNPEVTVHVSEHGARHLISPERLERSSRRVFGEAYDQLWGGLTPIAEEQLHAVADGDQAAGLTARYTPGHASHHVAWVDSRGGHTEVFTGDVAGVRIQPCKMVQPVAPPPDIDVAAWRRSIQVLREIGADKLSLTHFGSVQGSGNVHTHLEQLEHNLDSWSAWLVEGITEPEFVERVTAETHAAGVDRSSGGPDLLSDQDLLAAYDQTGPPYMSYLGLQRWAHQKY